MNYLITVFSMIFALSTLEASSIEETIHEHQTVKIKPSRPDLEKMRDASTLVISCVDFRLRDETARLLREQFNLLDDYDEIALPGASLAFVDAGYKEWGKTISDTIGILKKLHHIKQVVFLDHMGCGAYKMIKGADKVNTIEKEKQEHLACFREAKAKLAQEFPDLKFFTFIMELNGSVTRYD